MAKAKYGLTVLPVSTTTIAKYRLKVRHVKDIAVAARWAKGSKQKSVRRCESGNNYKSRDSSGYYGAWQFAYSSWKSHGGQRFGRTADKAPKWAQDYVAWKYWSKAGWAPWTCA